jgi:hypothetical protein
MSVLNDFVVQIPLLPTWAKYLSLQLLGVYVALNLVRLIIKTLQVPEISLFFSSLKKFCGQVWHYAAISLELPVKRPRGELVVSVLMAALNYVFAILIFAWFGVFFMMSVTAEHLVIYKQLLGLAIAVVYLVIARWYFASAERERIAAVQKWKKLRSPLHLNG